MLVILALLLAAAVSFVASASASSASSAGASAASQASPSSETGPLRVLVIGDSVILGARERIPGACADCEVVVDAAESRSTATSVAAAAAHEGPFDVIVALLGHNDAVNEEASQGGFDELFDQFALAPRIIVLTLHEVRPGYAELNAFLRESAERRPNVTVVDWNATVEGWPDATGPDDLHLTPAGAELLATVIGDAVEATRSEPAEDPDLSWEPDGSDGEDAPSPEALDDFWSQEEPEPAVGPSSRTRPVLLGVIGGATVSVFAVAAVAALRRRRER